MTDNIMISARTPDACTSLELAEFSALVRVGGEVVTQGFDQLLRNADTLFFARNGDCLVGTAALKRPRDAYRASVFSKAKTTENPESFSIEFGWVFVLPLCRRQGLSHKFAREATSYAGSRRMFATARADNEAMIKALLAAGFHRHARDFLSRGHHVALFLR